MNTLYCFKLNDDFTITKIEITDYKRIENPYSSRVIYSWDSPRINKSDSHFSITSDKLDRFTCNKVFTFTDDLDRAIGIIRNQLNNNVDKARIEYERCAEKLRFFDNELKGGIING